MNAAIETGQLSLLDVQRTSVSEALRCRMCARPARWLPARQQRAPYCAGMSCTNRERLCQRCGTPFLVNTGGAGTKYCGTECKVQGYHPTTRSTANCAWCGKAKPHPGRVTLGRVWPYICASCIDPIKHVAERLKAHRVPHERARRLVDDPGCEVCGADMLVKFREAGHGKLKALLVVDHDHNCCPVDSQSCGKCIRGLLCRHCNSAAGLLFDNPANAERLATYLRECAERSHP